jgi:hypothetical protein
LGKIRITRKTRKVMKKSDIAKDKYGKKKCRACGSYLKKNA